ncbi:MAG: hypothetical protein ACLFVS_07505 [Candidatus Acetothermia bacterium]
MEPIIEEVVEEEGEIFSDTWTGYNGPAGLGYSIMVDLSLEATEEGLYWLNVFLEEELITRMPLRIDYERVMEPGKNH